MTPLSTPRTPEQLQTLREAGADALTAATGTPPAAFTCDKCDGVAICPYAYDGYNVGEKCLAERK